MSFFSKLTKVIREVEKVVQEVSNAAGNANNAGQSPGQPAQSAPVYKPVNTGNSVNAMNSGEVRSFVADILRSEFGQYQLRENIPLSEFGREGRPYDFALYQNGQIKAFIVLPDKNKTRNHPYWNSEKLANELNIPFIHFYTHRTNNRDAVKYRIEHFIGA